MNVVDLIIKKRDGETLPADEIAALIDAYTRGAVPDYQMSAFLMAAFLQGLTPAETSVLTEAMLQSGRVLDLSDLPGRKVDKHSTGGVGDKVSLLLAPIVAACGVKVPMISGRGLGHTGGTLDKLDSIPGFRTDLSIDAYRAQLDRLDLVMVGQTDEMAPADRKLYALRDVTGTVEFIPFIASSIMSKKLAEGIDALVLDVKCGRGAFMKTEAQARRLAETLVAIGEEASTPAVALMTAMDTPLGRAVGNWPEVTESIRCLRGKAEGAEDVMTVTLALAGEMLRLGGIADTPAAGRRKAEAAVRSGAAFEKFLALARAQGGEPSILETPSTREGTDPIRTVEAPEGTSGFVAGLDALRIGQAALALDAGRQTMDNAVDPTAGLLLHKKPGEPIQAGEPLVTFYGQNTSGVQDATRHIRAAYTFSEEKPDAAPLLLGRYAGEGWDDVRG